MAKTANLPDMVAKVEKSGNRFNAFDTDGVKRTSEITTGARKKAFKGGYLLGRFTNKAGNYYWKKFEGELAAPVVHNTSVDVPADHAEVLNFIHSSYSLKPKALMMSELKLKYLILEYLKYMCLINS